MIFKKPAICASIMEATVENFLAAVRNVEDVDLIELRADGLKKATPAKVKRLLWNVKNQKKLPVILTNRSEKEGGSFASSEKERTDIIKECMPLADIIDIELRMDDRSRSEIIEKAKEQKKLLIVSYHDFNSTPDEETMLNILQEELDVAHGGIAKLAVKANSMEDVLKLLNVTQKAAKLGDVCTISIGSYGKIARLIAPLFGSAITYGYATKPTAEGQFSIQELKQLFEMLGVRK